MRFALPAMRRQVRNLKVTSTLDCPWEMETPVKHVMVQVPGTQKKETQPRSLTLPKIILPREQICVLTATEDLISPPGPDPHTSRQLKDAEIATGFTLKRRAY